MMEMKKTNRTNIQLMKMIMMAKIATKSKEIVHHRKRNQNKNHHTVGERLSFLLVI